MRKSRVRPPPGTRYFLHPPTSFQSSSSSFQLCHVLKRSNTPARTKTPGGQLVGSQFTLPPYGAGDTVDPGSLAPDVTCDAITAKGAGSARKKGDFVTKFLISFPGSILPHDNGEALHVYPLLLEHFSSRVSIRPRNPSLSNPFSFFFLLFLLYSRRTVLLLISVPPFLRS